MRRKKPSGRNLSQVRLTLELLEQDLWAWRNQIDPPKDAVDRWIHVLEAIREALQ